MPGVACWVVNTPSLAMNWFDLVVMAIVTYAALRGARKGFLYQAAWILALVVCAVFGRQFCALFAHKIHAPVPVNEWACMALMYLGASFVCFAGVRLLRACVEWAEFDDYDRHLGTMLGIAKGVLLCMVLIVVMAAASETTDQVVRPSMSRRATVAVMDHIMPALSDKMVRLVEPLVDELRDHDPSGTRLRSARSGWPNHRSADSGKETVDSEANRKRREKPPEDENDPRPGDTRTAALKPAGVAGRWEIGG